MRQMFLRVVFCLFALTTQIKAQTIFTDYSKGNCQSIDTVSIYISSINNGLISCQGSIRIAGDNIDSMYVTANGIVSIPSSGLNLINDSTIVFSWFSPSLTAITPTSDTSVFIEAYLYAGLGATVNVREVSFLNNPTQFEFINSNYSAYSFVPINKFYPITCDFQTSYEFKSGSCLNGDRYDTLIITPSNFDLNQTVYIQNDTLVLSSNYVVHVLKNNTNDTTSILCSSCQNGDTVIYSPIVSCQSSASFSYTIDSMQCGSGNLIGIDVLQGSNSIFGMQLKFDAAPSIQIDSAVSLNSNAIINVTQNSVYVSITSSQPILVSQDPLINVFYSISSPLVDTILFVDTAFTEVYDLTGTAIGLQQNGPISTGNINCNSITALSLLDNSDPCDYYRNSDLIITGSYGINSIQLGVFNDTSYGIIDSLRIARQDIIFNQLGDNYLFSLLPQGIILQDTIRLGKVYFHPNTLGDTVLQLSETAIMPTEVLKNSVSDSIAIDSISQIVTPFQAEINYGSLGFCPSDSVQIWAADTYDSYSWNNGLTADTIWISTPGTYYLIGTSTSGCIDTSSSVSISVKSLSYSTDSVVSCDSYTWVDGLTYTSSTNTPTYTYTASNGCDSVVTLNLTINTSETGVDVVTACDSYTWVDGVTYTSSTNTPTYTYTASNGCDSVVTLSLTINTSKTGMASVSACTSYTWVDGLTYTTSTNTPTYTYTASNGCDSVVTLSLTINQPTSDTAVVIACGSYTWIDGQTYTSSTTTPTYTLTGSNGCDSVVGLDLTIKSLSYSTDSVVSCDSYTWVDGLTYTSSTNTPTYTYTASNGCDSVVTLNLTINTSETGVDVVTACDSYTWVDGVTYTSSTNTPTYTYTASNGCDSVVNLDLTIESIDATVTLSGLTISALPGYDLYQWYECTANGLVVLNNETNDSIVITANGDYAVVINNNNCSDTSDCVTINNVGFRENNQGSFRLFPNPTQGVVKIERNNSASPIGIYQLQLVDSHGKVIQNTQVNFQDGFIVINLDNYPAGVYQLTLMNQHEVFHEKVSVVN